MRISFHPFELPLRHAFTISRYSVSVQKTLVVELEQDGVRGFGEATNNPYYGVTIQGMIDALEAIRPRLASMTLRDPETLWEAFKPALQHMPFAQCALDLAAHDLWGKLHDKPVYAMWGLDITHTPLTDYTIGIDTIDNMVAKMLELPDWPIYKIKLGTTHDLEIVRELRRHSQSIFRVDANGAWSKAQTLEYAGPLKELGVEFIEQPMAAAQVSQNPTQTWREMRELYQQSALPLIADESCIVQSDVDSCHQHFHGINIKLTKCGGLTVARRMIARAKELKLKTMVGCMTESTVGVSAIAQLLPLLDYVDMDAQLLVARDVATGVTLQQGKAIFPDTPGCGVRLL
jgi:L-alanine-DL-glutamate epimerase-like enolase superfamily enzyme